MIILAIGMFIVPTAGAISPGYTGETAATAGIGINGTVHDLRRYNTLVGYKSTGEEDYLDRLCIFCHAPHHAYKLTGIVEGTGPESVSADYTYLPLWNHDQTVQVFTPYYNGPDAPIDPAQKAAQSIANGMTIGAASLLCLSCHDGTVAVNQFGSTPQDTRSISTGAAFMTDQYRIGGDGYLANHHPIGFDYTLVSAIDLEIIPADVAVFDHDLDAAVYGAVPNAINVAGAATVDNFLYNNKMECATCHAVHNTGNSGEKLLYVSDQNSNLCFSCHLKGYKTGIGIADFNGPSTWGGGQINP